MISISTLPQTIKAVSTSSARRPTLAASRFGGIWASLSAKFAEFGEIRRLLALNDRQLRDIDVRRADLDSDAMFWPLPRPRSSRED